jgi:hypothetical protein
MSRSRASGADRSVSLSVTDLFSSGTSCTSPTLICRSYCAVSIANAARAAASLPTPKAAFLPFSLSLSRSTTPTSAPFHVESAHAKAPMTYEDAPDTRRSRDASNPPYFAAKRAIGAFLSLPTGMCCRVSRTSTPTTDPALISTIPAVSPRKPQPATTRAREPPPVLPCETPESLAPSTKRYTPHDLHRLFGGRKLPDFKILAELGTGIEVKDSTDPLLSVCDDVNL